MMLEPDRATIASCPLPMWTMAPDGSVMYVNPAWQRATGADDRVAPAVAWSWAIHPDDAAPLSACLQASPGPIQHDVRFRSPDGVYRWHLLHIAPVGGNVPSAFWIGTAIAIDARRRTEDSLRLDAARCHDIIDSATDIVYSLDLDGRITSVNRAAEHILGYVPADILGHSIEETIIPPDQLEAHQFSLNPTVGAGPYSFVRYETDQFVELEANPNYWGEAPAVDRLFLRILQAEIAVAELESGNLDLISVSIDNLERLQQNPNLNVASVKSPSMDSISLNLDLEYFQDKRLRQAMMYGINRQGIVDSIYAGNATVRNSPIFGPDWMGVPEGLNEYAYDPDQARTLVQEAGWDTNRTVEMMYSPAGNTTFANMVPIIQQQLGEIGIKVELLQLDAAEINRKLITDHDYEIYIGGGGVYGADPNVSSRYYLSNSFTPNGANSVWYANPEVDDLYKQGREAGTQEDRKAIYTELAQLLNEELPSIFLWSPNTNFASTKRLQGFLPPAYVDNRLWNVQEWSVTE